MYGNLKKGDRVYYKNLRTGKESSDIIWFISEEKRFFTLENGVEFWFSGKCRDLGYPSGYSFIDIYKVEEKNHGTIQN